MIRVTAQPVDTGRSGWSAVLPARDPQPALTGAVHADVLVIGGGFAGLSALRRYTELEPTARAVLLEASVVGEGPAGRNSGFMIDLPHDLSSSDYGGGAAQDKLVILQNREAVRFAAAARDAFRMPPEAVQTVGKINGAATEKGSLHNREYAAHLASLGESSETLDRDAMRRITGSDYYRDGLYTPGTAMLQPVLYTRALADGLVTSSGGRVTVRENSGVVSLDREGKAWVAKTANGSVTADAVILAVNGHAESFGFYQRRLMHVFTYASMTRALSADEVRRLGGESTWSLTPSDPMGTTVRRISGVGGDRIVVRNRFTCDPSMQVDDARVSRVGEVHDESFVRRFPMLADVDMEYRWGGRLCLAWNGAPAFSSPEPGLHIACCQNGLGAARGTLSGMAAAERAAGVPSVLADQLEAEPAPRRLPPEPFAALGANAVMRWKEFQAGAER